MSLAAKSGLTTPESSFFSSAFIKRKLNMPAATSEFARMRKAFQKARRRKVSPYYDLPTFCDHGPDHRTGKLHRYTACYLPELAARLIRKHSRPGDTVVDCFL